MKCLTGTKFGIENVPNGISKEIEPKDGKADCNSRENGNPWSTFRKFLSTSLKHQSPCRDRFLDTESKVAQRGFQQDCLANECSEHD